MQPTSPLDSTKDEEKNSALRRETAPSSHGGKTRDESATRLAGAEPSHTPAPWRQGQSGNGERIYTQNIGEGTGLIAQTLHPGGERIVKYANAAFIVAAVNAHYKLVAALKDLLWEDSSKTDEARLVTRIKAAALLAEVNRSDGNEKQAPSHGANT